MTKVLYLAYHFPPIGGAGVQRNAKFVHFLPEFDYDPIVVAGPGLTADRWTPMDDTMEPEIPVSIEVVRVPGPEPAPSAGWRARAERWLGLRTPWLSWLLEGIEEQGMQHGEEAELIYASLVPYDLAEAAARLSRRLGKPWVADLQDPWALDEMMVFASGIHRRREVKRMRTLLSSATAIVMNTPEATARLAEAFPELASRAVTVPNGFDGADFAAPVTERTDSAFRIVHTGYLHTGLGRREQSIRKLRRLLGGALPGVDILTRSHVFLLEAVASLVEAGELPPGLVEIHLAGVMSADDVEVAKRYPFVTLHGYVPHHGAVELMRTADLLFLPMQALPPETRATIVPGKTYEYLASESPILASIPAGDAHDLLARAGNTWLVPPGDTAAIAGAVRAAALGEPPVEADRRASVLAPYERRRLTSDLAGVFDHVREGTRTAAPQPVAAGTVGTPGGETTKKM